MYATSVAAMRRSLRAHLVGRDLLVALIVALLTASTVNAADVVRVEEDWELVLLAPDATLEVPQITCVISPDADPSSLHAAFELNHRTQPDYSKGGMQFQLWSYENLLVAKNGPKLGLLATADETVRWTQKMKADGGSLSFEVASGTSTTWGTFGGQGYLKYSVSTSHTDLNDYDPNVSVKHTGIGFGANRVKQLVLKRVRKYSATGLISDTAVNQVVHQHE